MKQIINITTKGDTYRINRQYYFMGICIYSKKLISTKSYDEASKKFNSLW